MTFLELQKRIMQTRKARKGTKNRIDYFQDPSDSEEFWIDVYKRALRMANEVVKHYGEKGGYDQKEKMSVVFGREEKKRKNYFDDYKKKMEEYNEIYEINQNQNKELLESKREIRRLNKEIKAMKEELARVKRGGRYKDYVKESQVVKYKQANPAATVREIARALGISTTTVQKALVANGLNKQKG